LKSILKENEGYFAGKNPSSSLAHVFMKAKRGKMPRIYAIYTAYLPLKHDNMNYDSKSFKYN